VQKHSGNKRNTAATTATTLATAAATSPMGGENGGKGGAAKKEVRGAKGGDWPASSNLFRGGLTGAKRAEKE